MLRQSLHNSAWVQHHFVLHLRCPTDGLMERSPVSTRHLCRRKVFAFDMISPQNKLPTNDINLQLTHFLSTIELGIKSRSPRPTSRNNLCDSNRFHYWSLLMCLTVCGTQKSFANKSDRIKRVNIAPHAPDSFLLILSIFEIHPSLCHFVLNLPSDKSLLCHEVYDLRLHVAREECFLSFFIRFFSKGGRGGGGGLRHA